MKKTTFLFLLIAQIITACTSNNPAPISTIPVDTSTPVSINTIVPSPTSSLRDIKCTEVKPGNLDELNSRGTIVFHDMYYEAYTVNLSTLKKVKLNNEDEVVISIVVSPDRQWTAYYLYSDSAKLVIMNSSGSSQITIPWEEDWNFISSWLDNERLLINNSVELSEDDPAAKEFSTFLVFNPFTGERVILQPDFPEVYSHHMFAAWDGFGSTVYNPTLDRVVYMRADSVDSDFHYVLWNIDEQSSLADFRVFVNGQDIPRWSPDGEKFSIAFSLLNDISNKWLVYNLYTVSRDGDLVKLTDLSKYYSWYYIGQHSWSPDGRYIAFWFSGRPEPPQFSDFSGLNVNQHLGVVDTKNNDLSIYCMSGKPQGNGIVPPPVWSPDGQQILIESPLPGEHSQVLLLDLNGKVVAEIGKDMTPIGWMVEP